MQYAGQQQPNAYLTPTWRSLPYQRWPAYGSVIVLGINFIRESTSSWKKNVTFYAFSSFRFPRVLAYVQKPLSHSLNFRTVFFSLSFPCFLEPVCIFISLHGIKDTYRGFFQPVEPHIIYRFIVEKMRWRKMEKKKKQWWIESRLLNHRDRGDAGNICIESPMYDSSSCIPQGN